MLELFPEGMPSGHSETLLMSVRTRTSDGGTCCAPATLQWQPEVFPSTFSVRAPPVEGGRVCRWSQAQM